MEKHNSSNCSSGTTGQTLRFLMLAVCFSAGLMSQDPQHAKAPPSNTFHARAVLGLDGISNNTSGDLSIRDDVLVFKPGDGAEVQIPLGSIQDGSLSQEDKEMGGTPMALTRAATPYAGGRVIGLFAHKKYDFLTLEYLDANGGFHGAIWQLNKSEGQILGNELAAEGVHITAVTNVSNPSSQETKDDTK